MKTGEAPEFQSGFRPFASNLEPLFSGLSPQPSNLTRLITLNLNLDLNLPLGLKPLASNLLV